jgi:hypothetical protein
MLISVLLATLIQPPPAIQFATRPDDRPGFVRKEFDADLACSGEWGTELVAVSASHPQMKSDLKNHAIVNEVIEQDVFRQLDLARSCEPAPVEPPEDMPAFSRTEICYLSRLTKKFVSLSCQDSWDGGAHPDAGMRSLNFFRRTGQVVDSQRLFAPGNTGEIWALIRKHTMVQNELGSLEAVEYPGGPTVESMSETVWFTDVGVHFEYYHRIQGTHVADVPWEEVMPFLEPSVAKAVK